MNIKKTLLCLSLLATPAFADFSYDRGGRDHNRRDGGYDRHPDDGRVTCWAKSSFRSGGREYYGSAYDRRTAADRAMYRCRSQSLLPIACRIVDCDFSGRYGDRDYDAR